ncbi:hypothetical protein QTP86_009296 [Hemibagrus guttatus]|nr:hypothetical protein QTP86_009296 [Hemibagrus guttatus]
MGLAYSSSEEVVAVFAEVMAGGAGVGAGCTGPVNIEWRWRLTAHGEVIMVRVCLFEQGDVEGGALEWASAVWDADPQVKSSFAYFVGMIQEVFEYPSKDISRQLMELRQGSETAADYAIRLAAQSGWNDVALWSVFRTSLNSGLQAELACHVEATSLSQFVSTAIRLDNLRCQHPTGTQASDSACPRVHMDYPDPDLPFVVEVDASSRGLGAVLSQWHGEPGKLHPCAFYSRKLISAEVNYDMGNWELLAIKAALEEWRHWLEGARHLFQVFTDHHI